MTAPWATAVETTGRLRIHWLLPAATAVVAVACVSTAPEPFAARPQAAYTRAQAASLGARHPMVPFF